MTRSTPPPIRAPRDPRRRRGSIWCRRGRPRTPAGHRPSWGRCQRREQAHGTGRGRHGGRQHPPPRTGSETSQAMPTVPSMLGAVQVDGDHERRPGPAASPRTPGPCHFPLRSTTVSRHVRPLSCRSSLRPVAIVADRQPGCRHRRRRRRSAVASTACDSAAVVRSPGLRNERRHDGERRGGDDDCDPRRRADPRGGGAHVRAGGIGPARRLGCRGHQDRARPAGRRHAGSGGHRASTTLHGDVHALLEHSNRGKQSLAST